MKDAMRMSTRTDLEHLDANVGDKISGVYRRMPTLNSGRFALIEQSRECVLVPGPVLERARGQWSRSGRQRGNILSIDIKRGMDDNEGLTSVWRSSRQKNYRRRMS
ncbi:DUF3363 domain-containing protein [Bradyrhizobium ivorense]|uniref:DUF3363 domain-containing protein n=1 Tax=Bradyrhizobium ivorense TaxID=2511166 RepID=UPI0011161B09|nr:DUF3363 domain-containing protein [Bradyrhizobium ivorense]